MQSKQIRRTTAKAKAGLEVFRLITVSCFVFRWKGKKCSTEKEAEETHPAEEEETEADSA